MTERCDECGARKAFVFEDDCYYCHKCAWLSEHKPRVVTPFHRILNSLSLDELAIHLHSMNIDYSIRKDGNKHFVRLSTPDDSAEVGCTNQDARRALVNAMVRFFVRHSNTDFHDLTKSGK